MENAGGGSVGRRRPSVASLRERENGRRITALFETGAEQFLWLNGIVSVGSGRLIEGGVAYDVFELQ